MTNILRNITLDNHKRAERTAFLKRILKKTITPYEYYLYLTNMFLMYSILEDRASSLGVFNELEELKRSSNLREDIEELEHIYGFETPVVTDAAHKYYEYILNDISEDYQKLLAHIYVRHMGDLSGGQVIKKLVPGSGKHYSFDGDINLLKGKVREKLSDDLGEEANKCFDMIVEFLDELEQNVIGMENIDDMGKTDDFAEKSAKSA